MEAPATPAEPTTPAAPVEPWLRQRRRGPRRRRSHRGGDLDVPAAEDTDVNEPWDMSQGYVAADTDNLGSRLIDQPVYSSTGDDAEEIGNISDLVFDENGQITAVVIGVGGFLGIGEKAVAADFNMLEFTLAADNTERWVLPTTAEALTAAPDFVWEEDEPADLPRAAPWRRPMAAPWLPFHSEPAPRSNNRFETTSQHNLRPARNGPAFRLWNIRRACTFSPAMPMESPMLRPIYSASIIALLLAAPALAQNAPASSGPRCPDRADRTRAKRADPAHRAVAGL